MGSTLRVSELDASGERSASGRNEVLDALGRGFREAAAALERLQGDEAEVRDGGGTNPR